MSDILDKVIQRFLSLRNRHFVLLDVLLLLLIPVIALWLRYETLTDILSLGWKLGVLIGLLYCIKLPIFWLSGLYRRYWRYASADELIRTIAGISVAILAEFVLFFGLLKQTALLQEIPNSFPFLDGLLTFVLVGGVRFSARLGEQIRGKRKRKHYHKQRSTSRVLIAGAGKAGVMVVDEMKRNSHLGLVPVGFVDDDEEKVGTIIRGIPVLGSLETIPILWREQLFDQVLIAMPTASGKVIGSIVGRCKQWNIPARTIPGVFELLDDRVTLQRIREIRIEDLLRRAPIEVDSTQVRALLRGRRVLVTGAGGSIGSELCRQILRCEPELLVLLGHGENSIFAIHQELKEAQAGKSERIRLEPFIADIRSSERIKEAFLRYQPEVVFHAAAHKHVPMMEMNPVEAVTNNIWGTQNLVEISLETGVEAFVLVSTDKAVNPTSTMGATKRVAEMIVLNAARNQGKRYMAVRFGNVLGSRGSVLPVFERQIRKGGPITVTHPEVRRYFMTIPEAVQLVLQASVLGNGGEIFVLKMGQAIKIVDLARELIRLHGYEEGKDIEIVFTGLRPGEKLYEELFIPGENYDATMHEEILIARNASTKVPSLEELQPHLVRLYQYAFEQDAQALRNALRMLVPEYQEQLVFQAHFSNQT